MIVCVIGTRAQLIKMAPVILECERRSWPVRLVMTGQHRETMDDLLAEFGIQTQPVSLNESDEITSAGRLGFWFIRSLWKCLTVGDIFPLDRSSSIFLVHGDTASTLLGALVGKMLGFKVAHVEAGLRSGHLFHPFPEELIRHLVGWMADYAFCPGEWALKHVSSKNRVVINTQGNTLIESVSLALDTRDTSPPPFSETYGVVSIHRFENIFFKRRLQQILELIECAAEKTPLLFVLHPATRVKLMQFEFMSALEANQRITLMDRMAYRPFIHLLSRAQFVVTDGGSNQEELSYLGIPTLLMRKATERVEGMTSTACLCQYEKGSLMHFLEHAKPQQAPTVKSSPSRIILDALTSFV